MRRRSRLLFLTAATLAAAAGLASPAAAQSWLSAWGGLYMDPATVTDFDTDTRWDFGTSFVAGASYQRRLGGSLIAGVEASYSPIRHEVRRATSDAVLDDGRGHLITTMATGRLGAAPVGGFATYLAGGIGAMTYGIPYLDAWDTDLALRAGGGLDYGYSQSLAFFLEWHRWWVFHQAEGVEDNTIRHSNLQLGIRFRR